MKKMVVLIGAIFFIASCTNVAGWKARLNNGVDESQSGEYRVTNPIADGFCLRIEELNDENSETVGFHDCQGYVAEYYVLTWYEVEDMDTEAFYERTENTFIPDFSKDIFQPIDEGVLVTSNRENINGQPAVVFDVETKTGAEELRLRSSSIFYEDRVCWL